MLDMVLTPAQLTGLLAAVLGIALLAVFTGTRRKSASASNGTAIVAGIIMGTLVGGSATVGTAQLAYHYGMSAWWFTLGGGLACLVLALGFIGPWRRSGSQTLIGILAKEFGPGAGLAASLLSSVGTFINVISQLIAGTAVIAVAAPSLGLVPALLIGCGVMVLVLSGGVSGFLQTVNGIDNPAAIRFGSLFARGIGKDGGAALSLILGVLTTQTYAQAVLSAKSDAAARRGTLISAVLIPPIGTGGILVGLFMRAHHPGIAAKTALTAFATGYLPPVLSGILLGTLFIAVVVFDKAGEDKAGSLMGKGIIVLTLLLGVILSSGSLGDTILNFAFMSMGLRGAVVFVPMLCALWAPGKVNRKCAMGAIIAGPVVVLLCGTLFTLPGGIDPLFAGVTAALIFCAAGRILGNRVEHIRILHGGSGAAVPVIALDTELYSGGEALGAALSSRLGIPCYGEEILTKAAELSGIPEGILRRYDGRSIVAAYDLTADDPAALHLPTTGSLISAQLAACKALAEKGPCILVDRFASHALSGESIPVYLSADFDQRAAELARQKNLGPAAARRQLKRQDRARSRYYRNGNRNWGYAKAYAVSVNATGADPEELAMSLTAFLVPDAQKAQRKTAG